MDCEDCGGPIDEERAARLGVTRCTPCQARVDRLAGLRHGVDDLRSRRDGLPDSLRRVEPMWEED
jgi:RNA polymerase-binding transcription factor DksA